MPSHPLRADPAAVSLAVLSRQVGFAEAVLSLQPCAPQISSAVGPQGAACSSAQVVTLRPFGLSKALWDTLWDLPHDMTWLFFQGTAN